MFDGSAVSVATYSDNPVRRRQATARALRPLDEFDSVLAEEVVQTDVL